MTTKLNPFAPEYNPIQPGITPSRPPRLFFYSPPSAAYGLPPLSPSLPYLPSTYSTYVTSHNQVSITPPPQQQPPPRSTAVSVQYGQPGRGLTPRGRGFGRGRGRGRGASWSDQRLCNSNFERRLKTHEKNSVGLSRRGMHKDENRHKITPLNRDEENTTVMIKNIPYACPRKELISMLDEFCLLENRKAGNEGTSIKEADHQEQLITYAYDFLYLPIDFRTKKSRGFAFVNFTNSKAAWKLFDSFHLKKWEFVERLQWPKKIEIVSAKIQGKEDLVKHFSESVFECETDEYLPVRFRPARDGSGQEVEVTVVGNRLPVGKPHAVIIRPKTW